MAGFDPKLMAGAVAFIGNSLLTPINQTPKDGLIPAFWDEFPDFGDGTIRESVAACRTFSELGSGQEMRAALEFTKLFVGPPKPAAPPWETSYRSEGDAAGFGQATVEMRSLLRDAGLELSNSNHQYEDHMGIELLLLSVMLERSSTESAARFAREHPLSWIVRLSERVHDVAPNGYYDNLLVLAANIMRFLVAEALPQ